MLFICFSYAFRMLFMIPWVSKSCFTTCATQRSRGFTASSPRSRTKQSTYMIFISPKFATDSMKAKFSGAMRDGDIVAFVDVRVLDTTSVNLYKSSPGHIVSIPPSARALALHAQIISLDRLRVFQRAKSEAMNNFFY